MQLKMPYWNLIHPKLVEYKSLIMKLFLVSYVFGFLLIVLGFLFFSSNPVLYLLILKANSLFATLALVLFSLTLLPGIFQRFKVFPLFSASIVLFRRQLGILMFIVALVHSAYVSTIPAILTSTFGLEFMTKTQVLGTLSLMILLPVWLTSNDISMRKFGKFWKTLQRLSYLALFAIFFHVAQTSTNKSAILFVVIFLEVSSWIKVKFFNKKT